MDNAIGLGIILSLKDKASAGLDAVRNKMTALRDASQDMVKRFDEGAKQMVAGFASMATGGKILGLLESTFGSSVATAADFEQAMARVGAVSGATGEDFERLTQQAKELGAKTQFSASQAAASQESLARAGFKTNEIISAMPGLLNMAAAEGMDLANAADIAASAIAGFGLDASEAGRVADVLAKTSAASNTSIALLGESLKYVAPIAKGLGFSIEQVNAMLGVMANAGIKGSQAGTALKSAFQRLSAEPKQTAAALELLGIKAKTAQGDMRPLPELMEDLAKKTQNMGKADKLGILSKVFGGVASSGMLAIMDSVANGKLPELEEALYNCSGAAQAMADRMNATAQGAMKRLESASEGLRIVIGNHLLPAYTWIIDTMAEFKGWLTQLIEEHPVISKAVIGFTTALLGLSGTAFILVGALASIGGFIKMWPLLRIMASVALSSIRAQARTALISLSGLRVPVVGLAALAGVLFYAWRKNLWGIRDMVTAVAEGFKMAWNAGVNGIVDVDDALMQKLKDAGIWDYAVIMGQVFFRIRKFWDGFIEGVKDGVSFLMGAVDWLKGLFAPAIESGQTLLRFLGILKPAVQTHAETWWDWGRIIGSIAPIAVSVITAFKGLKVIKGIFGDLGKSIFGMFKLIKNHPFAAIVFALVALGIYLYAHWDEIIDWLQKRWQNFIYVWNTYAPVLEKIIPVVLAVITALKMFTILPRILSIVSSALSGLFSLVAANPYLAVIMLLVAAGIYLYTHWEEISAKIAEYGKAAADWVRKKWQGFMDWWNSWTMDDVFAAIYNWFAEKIDKIRKKWDDFSAWWDSWTFADIFAPIYEFAASVCDKVKQPFIDFKNWLLGIFANMNPFNWSLPSWLGGGKAGDNQVKNAEAAMGGYQPPSIPTGRKRAEGGFITRPEFSLIGEAGAEVIIPLTKQARGASLWYEAGRELGLVSGNNPIVQAHATGGIFSQPHLGLVAEAGREAVIPLTKQARGASLWYEAGRELGLVSGNTLAQAVPQVNIMNSQSTSSASQTIREETTTLYNSITNIPERRMPRVNAQGTAPYGAGRGASLLYEVARTLGIVQNNNINTENSYPNLSNNILMSPLLNRVIETVLPRMNTPTIGWYNTPPFVSAPENRNRLTFGGQSLQNSIPQTFLRSSALSNVSNSIYPHAEGGIFTSPHIGLVAEAGPEAIIPLTDRTKAMPMLSAAMAMVGGDTTSNVDINKPYSSSMLIQHSLNQAALYGQQAVPQGTQPAQKEAPHNSKIEVNAEIRPADIYIDGERVGRVAFRWFEHQNVRNGVSPF